MAKLARAVQERELDWVEMRARCKRLLDRTEKAAKAAETAAQETNGQFTETGGNAAPGGSGGLAHLTPAQAIMQAKIMSRRRLIS
jgi:hypothetical protein